ncbi:MAG TPA: hypothetical protein VI413_09690 [Paludibacter sp.]
MKNVTFFKTIILTVALAIVTIPGISQILVAGWDFQTTENGGTAIDFPPLTPDVIIANFGTGTLYLDGTNGSSKWNKTIPENEISAYSSCYHFPVSGFSPETSGAASLGLLGGTNGSASGKHIVFKFSMTEKSNLIVKFLMQRNQTGFISQSWDYSTDCITWTHFKTITDLPLYDFEPVKLDTIKGLDNAETAYLRMSPEGATDAEAYNKIDNVQLYANVSVLLNTPVAKTSETNISISNGIIKFNAKERKQVEIFNAIGQKLISTQTTEGLNTIPVSAKGMVIIKIDNRISKVIL